MGPPKSRSCEMLFVTRREPNSCTECINDRILKVSHQKLTVTRHRGTSCTESTQILCTFWYFIEFRITNTDKPHKMLLDTWREPISRSKRKLGCYGIFNSFLIEILQKLSLSNFLQQ